MLRLLPLLFFLIIGISLVLGVMSLLGYRVELISLVGGLMVAVIVGFLSFQFSIWYSGVTRPYKPQSVRLTSEEKVMGKPAKIFLNYSRDDEVAVDKLFNRLSEEGYEPWMDKKSIVGGEEWKDSIRRSIAQCDVFVACLSSRSVNKRGFIQWEIKYALDRRDEMLDSDIFVIPVRLEDCEVPDKLSRLEWIDLYQENGWNKLTKAIQEALERRK